MATGEFTGAYDPLDAVLAEYLQAAEAGNAPPREAVLAAHPELGDRLRAFFADFDSVGRDASKFRLPDPQATVTAGSAGTSSLPTVRYLGDYELVGEIARGGMGVVYRARQVTLNRAVALKMILAGTYATPHAVQRFRAEAEAAASLDHPNILPIYEVGEHEGHQYFSMKLVEGGSLADKVGALKGRPRETAELMATLARAVQFAHQRGILHRDLKPANVLLDPDGTPYVTDFGLAKRVDADDGSTRTGSVVGTPSYMPPEQARGERGLTTAADVYSLGAILYELLTGQPPFKGESVFDTVKRVIEVGPPDPRALDAGADRDLCVIALKCLSKEPPKRYTSSSELADDLERYARGEPIAARPVGQFERARMWVKRNKAVAGLAAAVLLTLTAGVIVSSVYARLASDEARTARTAEADAREAEENARTAAKQAQEQMERADSEATAARKAKAEAQEREKAEAAAKQQAQDSAQAAQDQRLRAEDSLRKAEWSIYAGKLLLAQAAYNENNVSDAFRHLEECQWDLRGWEHAHLRWRFDSSKQTLKGHTDRVTCVAFSPDGKRILTGSIDRAAKVWDVVKGIEVLSLNGHTREVTSVAFSPDGKKAFAWAGAGRVLAWDTTTGQPATADHPPPRSAPGPATSPDGRLSANPYGTQVQLVDLRRKASEGSPWPFPDAAERKRYHSEQAALAEKDKQWFAAAFHLGRLLLDDPDNADLKRRRDTAARSTHDQPGVAPPRPVP